MVRILIEKGAKVNVLGKWEYKSSPLYFATLEKNRDAIIALCQAGAKPELDDKAVHESMKQLIRENCLCL